MDVLIFFGGTVVSGFTKVPNKIFTLGLNAYEIACFLALLKFADKNGSNVFPSWEKIGELAGGVSRAQVHRCIKVLLQCNCIQWDRGFAGRSNNYTILGEGCWKKKNVDKSVDKSGGTVSIRDGHRLYQTLPTVSNRDPINTHFNKNQLSKGAELESLGAKELLEKIKAGKNLN